MLRFIILAAVGLLACEPTCPPAALAGTAPFPETWNTNMKPWYQRNCAGCHRDQFDSYSAASGSAGWVTGGSMPRGRALSSADRFAFQEWVACGLPLGEVADAGSSVTPDGGPVDAGPHEDISCGSLLCNASTAFCCADVTPVSATQCLALGDETVCDAMARCDGPEDCPGARCCFSTGGSARAECHANCAGPELCHDERDCPAGDVCCTVELQRWPHRECFGGTCP